MAATATSITAWLSRLSAARLQGLFAQPQHAADWVHAVALDGIAPAQVCYGRMLLGGTGVPKNEAHAVLWFGRAARQGDLDAINMLGRCHENGWGCPIDVVRAAACFHEAADAGHDWAQYNLGHLYLDGLGVRRDVTRAYGYYLRASQQGHARAMNLAGRCCEQGWGTPPDAAAAAQWYRRSAAGGYFRGQYNWASVLLRAGRDIEAVAWFERAARAGTPAVRQAVLQLAAHAADSVPMSALADRLRACDVSPCA